MSAFYLILRGLTSIISLAAFLAPTFFYFRDRKKTTDFTRQMATIAKIDLAYLCVVIYTLIATRALDIGGGGSFIDDLVKLIAGSFMLYSLWCMKPGKGFSALFKNPGINSVLHIVYLATTLFITFDLAMTLFNYLIVGAIIIFAFWLLFFKLDVLGSLFDVAATSGSSSSGGGTSNDGFPLGAGDDTCDASVNENGINHKLNKTADGGFEDESGRRWVKTQNGGVKPW